MKSWSKGWVALLAVMALLVSAPVALAAKPIVIAQLAGVTGPYEAYAKQAINGFKMGIEYATGGTNTVLGRPIKIIVKDTHLKPDRGKQLLTEALQGRRRGAGGGSGVLGRGPGLPAGGQGVQARADRGAGRGRFHHRQGMEPLHLPHRAQLLPGRGVQRPGRGQARGVHRHPGPGLRLWPRRSGRLQGRGREGRGQGGARGVRAHQGHRLHRSGPAHHQGP